MLFSNVIAMGSMYCGKVLGIEGAFGFQIGDQSVSRYRVLPSEFLSVRCGGGGGGSCI